MDEVKLSEFPNTDEEKIVVIPKKGLAISSLVFAILAFIPLIGFISGIVAIVLGISAKVKKNIFPLISTLGIIIGVIALISQPFTLYFIVSHINVSPQTMDKYTNTLGIDKSSNYVTMGVPFAPISSSVNRNTIKFEIKNDAREDLTLNEFSVSITSPKDVSCNNKNLNLTEFKSGESKVFLVDSCQGIKSGDLVFGSLKISYNLPGSSIPLETTGTFSASSF